ncbi:MAG: efflux RND transporter periplasmic adaptor subunit [Saprospiraceae bacterium]|nr:efflux RND transporter periplasmic adaptor subunit [Saprospiraceae bacterium]
MRYSHFLMVIGLFLWAGCQPVANDDHADAFAHDHHTDAAHDHEDGMDNSVGLTVEQMKSINLKVGPIEHRNLSSSIKASGYLNVPSQNKATVNSLFAGVVDRIFVRPGSMVTKGQALATLVSPEFIPIQEEYLALQPKIKLARSEVERQRELSKGNAGSQKNLQMAEATLEGFRIRRAALGRQLTLMGIDISALTPENLSSTVTVRSPIRGSVGNVMVNMGAHVGASTVVAEVIDNSRLHLDLFVYEKDLPHVKKGQSIQFILTNQPGKSYQAEVFSIGTTFESESKTIAVHSVVKGDINGLIEGMSVTAQLNVKDERVPSLPSTAIANHDGMDYVFMVQKKNPEHSHDEDEKGHAHPAHDADPYMFERIPVKKGVSELGYTAVTLLSEAPDSARFVTEGSFFLLSKMTNAGEAHQH